MCYSMEQHEEILRAADKTGIDLEILISDLEEIRMMCCVVRRMAQRAEGSFPKTLGDSAEGLQFAAECVRDDVGRLIVDIGRAVDAREHVAKVLGGC